MKNVVLLILTGAAAFGAGPELVVLEKDAGTLAILDPAAGKVLARVTVGEGPHEIAVSSDGRFAFVGNYGGRTPGNTISVVDLAVRKELVRVDLGPLRRPHGMFFFDGKVYFTAEMNKLIGRYDPGSNQVDWLLGTGQNTTHMVLVSKDGARIYTANIGSDSICVIDRANGNETVVPVGKGPEGMDLSPEGKELWVAHSKDGGVSVIDVAAKKVTQTLDVRTKRSNRLKFTPDGKRVLISDLDAGELVVLDAASRKELQRLPVGKTPEGILMAPDGSRAYVALAGENALAVLDLKAPTVSVIGKLETGKGPDGMAWVESR